MSLTCLIITKNRKDSLIRLVRSIEIQTQKPDEVIIVNDAGEIFEIKCSLPIQWIHLEKSVQSGRARNEGMKRVKTDWVLMMDDDVELQSESFIESAKLSQINETIGLVFPRKTDCYADKKFELSFFESFELTGELKGISIEKASQIIQRQNLLFGPMVYFIRKQAFIDALGYDSIYGLGRGHSFREESDFQKRVQLHGWGVKLLENTHFYHWIQKKGGHGPNDHKRVFWIMHNQVVFSSRSSWFWPIQTLLFCIIELPRYAWGNGRLMTYPAGILGALRGLITSLKDIFYPNQERRFVL